MSQPGAVGDYLELSEIDSWPHNHADEEPHGTVSRNYQEHHRMSSSGSAAGSSTAFDPLEAPKTWKEWLDRALRINKAAGDMTRARAVTLVLLSFFFVLTTSLLVTGFQGLLPALLRDGVYSNLCDNSTTPVSSSSFSFAQSVEQKLDLLAVFVDQVQSQGLHNSRRMGAPTPGMGDNVCDRQRLRLNLMLTVAVATLNLVCFPIGIIVDKTGPRWVGLAGSFLTIIGAVLFAFSNSQTFDAYIPGYTLVGVGGVGIFMSLLHLLNVFPEHRGLLTTLYTATEDASTGVFYFFRLIHASGVSLRTLFLSYTSVPILHLLVVLLQTKRAVLNERTEKTREFYPVSMKPLRRQAISVQYITVLVWNALMGVTTYFYLSTLNGQLVWLFGSQELANRGTEIFSFFFMVFPFAAVPISGWLLDRLGTWPSLILVAFQCLLYGTLANIRVWWLQYITWATFVITRASFIGVSAHWVNQMFGENFSTLIGMTWTVGGFANMSNQLWVWIALNYFHSNYLIMNLVMTGISVASTIVAAIVVHRSLDKRGGHHILGEEPSTVHHFSDESLDTLTPSSDSDDPALQHF